jgi:hypothetical protein
MATSLTEITQGVGDPHKRPSDSSGPDFTSSRMKAWIVCGVFLIVLGVYALSSPGRIDIIDGQARFDVSYNWLVVGQPVVRDNWIGPVVAVPGRNGFRYSYYGAPTSIFGAPLVWLGLHTGLHSIPFSQFLFSLTSPIFGAAVAPILLLFYLELGVKIREAIAWTMVSSFATFLWPVANSTFDNAQHAFFALAAFYLGYLSVRRRSLIYAGAGGLLAGVLVLYQEYFLLIIPALALSTIDWNSERDASSPRVPESKDSLILGLASAVKRICQEAAATIRTAWNEPGEARSSCLRYGVFLGAVSVGIVLSLLYNEVRFGSWLDDGKLRFMAQRHHPLFGNPLAGFLTLLVSPGKSVFLYSPPLVLGVLGMGGLRRRKPELSAAIGISSAALVLFLSFFACPGGDWCWGPRYLLPLLPLWALAFPFALRLKAKRRLAIALITAGVLVQLLALSVENQRFFFDRGFNDFFWAEDSWVYFKHSALVARFGEALSLFNGLPSTAQYFNSLPVPSLTTYAPLGPPANVPRALAPVWIRHFQVFFLPRPWPLWMPRIPAAMRPINVSAWLAALFGVTVLGFGLTYRGVQRSESR